MCGVCACVREVCVVVLEQILQLYPVERQSKKKGVCIFYLYLFLKVSNVSITSIDGRAARI